MKKMKTAKMSVFRNKRFFTGLTAFLSLTVLLSGCTIFDASLDVLLSPPKLTEAQTAIYNALIRNTGEQIDLVYPRRGDYRSPFVLYDIDGEKTDEAIVFYREKASSLQTEGSLRINLLDQRDGEWISVYDRPLTGIDVEQVDFYNFSGTEGNINIVVSCSVLSQTEKSLCVLEYSEKALVPIYSGNYSFMDAVHLNSDQRPELFLVSYDAALGYNSAFILGNTSKTYEEGNSFGIISSIPLYSDVAGIQRLIRQRIKENDYLIFLDYGKGDNAYGTQILHCFNDNLTYISSESLSRRNNSNVPLLYSADIDGDGRIEIPVTVPVAGYESLTIPEQMFFVEWYYSDEENNFNVNKKFLTYVSLGGEYVFYMPVRWQGFVTIEKNGNIINFVVYEPGSSDPPVLLSICVSTSLPAANEGWERYGEKDSNVYIKTAAGGDPMALTADELKSCLSLTNVIQAAGSTVSSKGRGRK